MRFCWITKYLTVSSAFMYTLDIASDGSLQGTVVGMPTNNKRIHFCFERCTQKVIYHVLSANTGVFTLTGFDVNLLWNRDMAAETGYFTLPGTILAYRARYWPRRACLR